MEALAHFLADTLPALLVILLLIAPFLGPRPTRVRVLWFWGASAAGLAVAVLLAEAGKERVVWPGHVGFPSGHETFTLSCATSLVCWRPFWAWVVVPLAVIMGWALVTAHYHETADVWGAMLTGPPPALLCHALRLRRLRMQSR
jgi:membrane-associated phospholipid phosphatase